MDKPILFNTQMVQALLDDRKIQTRRAISNKLMANADTDKNDSGYVYIQDKYGDHHHILNYCPYGKVGDLLWVKETFREWHEEEFYTCGCSDHCDCATHPDTKLCYRADGYELDDEMRDIGIKWKPSIFMPRLSSRITLEITDIRVERVNDISEYDALNEGILLSSEIDEEGNSNPINIFKTLWDSINKKRGYGWDSNPLVWVVKFKVHKCNIDNMEVK